MPTSSLAPSFRITLADCLIGARNRACGCRATASVDTNALELPPDGRQVQCPSLRGGLSKAQVVAVLFVAVRNSAGWSTTVG